MYYLEVSLSYKIVEDETLVEETENLLSITITIPEEYRGHNDYYIIRNHNGSVEVLDSVYNSESSTITFETNMFSTYTVVYNTNNSVLWYLLLLLIIPIGYLGYKYGKQLNDKKKTIS